MLNALPRRLIVGARLSAVLVEEVASLGGRTTSGEGVDLYPLIIYFSDSLLAVL
ncbi:MAG: hypothetical protein MUQ10_13460 [Anaerolineae bacterium]|nr:hypothetical protein [Anaerolineae bacterium]